MSFIKLGQIADVISAQPQDLIGSVYIEDENGVVVQSLNPTFPLVLTVEVIDWVDEFEQQKHGKINSFNAELVTLEVQPENIREAVYQQLLLLYPELNK